MDVDDLREGSHPKALVNMPPSQLPLIVNLGGPERVSDLPETLPLKMAASGYAQALPSITAPPLLGSWEPGLRKAEGPRPT